MDEGRQDMGSLMCENKSCPKLLTDGVPNTKVFTKDNNLDACKCYEYYVVHAHCSVLKLVKHANNL